MVVAEVLNFSVNLDYYLECWMHLNLLKIIQLNLSKEEKSIITDQKQKHQCSFTFNCVDDGVSCCVESFGGSIH